jgi:uncharacterized protein YijF (DUF1287 family)
MRDISSNKSKCSAGSRCIAAAVLALAALSVCLVLSGRAFPAENSSAIVSGARKCVGNIYDAGYYSGGPPPKGRGACTDVLYYAFLKAGVNLQSEIDSDISRNPAGYPNIRDRNIDYRWCPNLIIWYSRYASRKPTAVNALTLSEWKAGDVVFWSIVRDGVADHCGIISDVRTPRGVPLVIHNFPPRCTEDDVLTRWMIVGHFRYDRSPPSKYY